MAVPKRLALCGLTVLLLPGPVLAQSGSLAPAWEVRQDLATLSEDVQRFKPLLSRAEPREWQGAPAAYVDQGKRIGAEIDYLIDATQTLAGHPEKLTTALTAYFRMQSLDLLLRSYAEGVGKYQDAGLAEQLRAALAPAAVDRDRLRQYILELASGQEQQLRVMDEEAQRCREALAKPPQRIPKAGDQSAKEERK